MSNIVILAEKPSVARDIAKIVGATQKKDGFLEGGNYKVTWAIGHLVGLAMPKSYGYENWDLSQLPIIPKPFKLEVTPDPGIRKQFKVIKELFSVSDQIIVATDAGREGELIFRYIYQIAKPSNSVEVKRLWISDLTEKTIKKGLQDLKPISHYDNLYYSGKARSEADWLVGINFTQAFTVASKKRKALSIGRVQTATLRIIVDRYVENSTFKKVLYYVPKITLSHNSPDFKMVSEEKYESKDVANQFLEGLKGTTTPPIKVNNKRISETPPVLYDLTTLQREANKMYGNTAKQTLDIAQSLYEKHKATTYPRTDSQHLADNQKEDVYEVFNAISDINIRAIELNDIKDVCLKNIPGSKVFNDSKVSDHHAIIPTTERIDIKNLNEKELQIYFMIVARFYQAFLDPCIKHTRSFNTVIKEVPFSSSTTEIINKGWRCLLPEKKEIEMLPDLADGAHKLIIHCQVDEGETKPKALFTENTLLAMMETAGKLVNHKALRETLKDKGLGTSATRAGIIETLIKRQYVLREKGKLIPTEIAIELIKAISHLSICSPELTGSIESKLNQIEKGTYNYSSFTEDMNAYVNELLPEIIKSGNDISKISTPGEKLKNVSFGSCPKCKNGEVRKGKKSTYCSNWNGDPKCDFGIWLNISGKSLSDTQIKELITKGSLNKIKGFKSKAGKNFEAGLKLDEAFKVNFVFNNNFKKRKA